MAKPGPILYVAAQLPKLSETFVYREVLALRSKGVDVRVASVHGTTESFDHKELSQLQSEAVVVYQPGIVGIFIAVIVELLTHPLRTISTISRGKLDAAFGSGVRLLSRPKVYFQCLAGISLARRIRNQGVRHIHAHFAHVPATIAMYTAKQLGIGFSFTGHANDLFQNRTLLSQKLKRAAFVSCISRWHSEWYAAIETAEESKRPVIRCGVDTNEFAPSEQTRGLIVCVARLVEKKGIDTLIEACSLLKERGCDFTCQIGGDGPMKDTLASMIESLGVGDRITLLGSMPNENVRSLVGSAAVFCLPCRDDSSGDRDGIPVALMESMASGVATVSGDLPAIRELIEDKVSGRLVQGGNAAELADILEQLLDDQSERVRLGQGGRQRVIDEFSLDVNAARLIKAFESAQY
jgi:colanic acid/amylovoran biosynthesis glycosyltransferase